MLLGSYWFRVSCITKRFLNIYNKKINIEEMCCLWLSAYLQYSGRENNNNNFQFTHEAPHTREKKRGIKGITSLYIITFKKKSGGSERRRRKKNVNMKK